MKNAQTFSNKVFELALLSDYERIASSFNRLLHSFYVKERNVFHQLRTLRQARIRLDMAAKIYEVDPRQSAYVVKLLKAEEELLGMIVSGKQHPDLYTEGESSLRCERSGRTDLRTAYGLMCQRWPLRHQRDRGGFRTLVQCSIAAYLQSFHCHSQL